jgi:hypothetical protein
MKRVLAAVALAFTVGGATAFTPSGALAATAPGPNAIPSDSLVQSINPDLAQVEEAGYRRKYRRHHGGSVMAFSFGVYPRPYPHSYGGYYPGFRRCFSRHRRLWTHRGWRIRPVRVCRGYGY